MLRMFCKIKVPEICYMINVGFFSVFIVPSSFTNILPSFFSFAGIHLAEHKNEKSFCELFPVHNES